eukprot:CAMPEP_0169283296 /NCGR_PEP_ID=MMETSP1016-20121227/57462_1 /TAXON_ID=342587 /ORGANISM="Karlodinium micrum, Strain CCMP2283" /LENGTH=105 /DNA_ID=CAMNT_0009372473 /DNA_START=1101 /DNA_END=1416 /DNA_ORIENTATION=+
MSSDQEKQSIRNHCCNRLKVGDQLQRKEVQESRWVEFLQNEGQELLWVLLVVHGLLALATTLMASIIVARTTAEHSSQSLHGATKARSSARSARAMIPAGEDEIL